MKSFTITLTAILLYVSAYSLTVEPLPDPWAGLTIEPYYEISVDLDYRWADRVDTAGKLIFAPLHWCDRRLRPVTWE